MDLGARTVLQPHPNCINMPSKRDLITWQETQNAPADHEKEKLKASVASSAGKGPKFEV